MFNILKEFQNKEKSETKNEVRMSRQLTLAQTPLKTLLEKTKEVRLKEASLCFPQRIDGNYAYFIDA